MRRRSIWYPRPVYEMLPVLYIVVAIVGASAQSSAAVLALSAMLALTGFRALKRRRDYRRWLHLYLSD